MTEKLPQKLIRNEPLVYVGGSFVVVVVGAGVFVVGGGGGGVCFSVCVYGKQPFSALSTKSTLVLFGRKYARAQTHTHTHTHERRTIHIFGRK